MNFHRADIEAWFKVRTERERLLVLLVGFAVIYALWNFLLARPMELKKMEIDRKSELMQTNIAALKTQADLLEEMAAKYAYAQKLQEGKRIAGQTQSVKQRLQTIESIVVTQEGLSNLTSRILSPQEGISLNSLKKLDAKPWVEEDVKTTKTLSSYSHIYKQNFEITFRGDYFSTMRYLNRLEKLPWRLYWDSLEYKVAQYPSADVIVRFYILVKREN